MKDSELKMMKTILQKAQVQAPLTDDEYDFVQQMIDALEIP